MAPLDFPSVIPQPAEDRLTKTVRLVSVGTSLPPMRLTQAESLQFALDHFDVKDSTKALYRRVFRNPSVQSRHFALDRLEDVLETDRDKINARFERWSARLGAEALEQALRNARVDPADLDFLAVTTCTGYICPGISSHLAERTGLRPDLRAVDIVGMGCGAAIPALEQAHNFLSAHHGGTAAAPSDKPGRPLAAAVVSVEICSAAMYSDDAADLVISNALFGDGAAAVVLQADGKESRDPGNHRAPRPALRGFASLTLPAWRESLRFKTQDGYLRNVLGKDVPRQAAEALEKLSFDILTRHGLAKEDVGHWIFHAGGEKILDEIETRLTLPTEALQSSRAVLRDFGNLSSPTVLFVLAEEMRRKPPSQRRWGMIASFGAGFSAHAALIEF